MLNGVRELRHAKYGASIIAFGVVRRMAVIITMYAVRRQSIMAVSIMAPVLLSLARLEPIENAQTGACDKPMMASKNEMKASKKTSEGF